MKLTLLLEIGVLLGAEAPMLIPFMSISLVGDMLISALAWDMGSLKAPSSLHGSVRASILTAGYAVNSSSKRTCNPLIGRKHPSRDGT